MIQTSPPSSGLYRPDFEKDSCGFGLIAQMDGRPSHWLVETAIQSLGCLTHRGAVAADGKTGDGCGLLLRMPDVFLRAVAHEHGWDLGHAYVVGMVFLNRDAALAAVARDILAGEIAKEGFEVLGWREVPTDAAACGPSALATRPRVEQIFANAPGDAGWADIERRLYVARRRAEKRVAPEDKTFYVSSLSSRVLSYKGLVMPANLPIFYPDLTDARFSSSIAVFHQRFSTNTWPEWRLAQPFRYLAHNGEINTIQGNRYWSLARSYTLSSDAFRDMEEIRPIVSMTGSDSLSLDNMLDALIAGGVNFFRAMRLLIPPAWQNVPTMDADLRAFYEYHSMHMEPWDGPAGIVLTDGRYASCVMDRNGLRPARWLVTRDRHFTIASETGVHRYDPAEVVAKGRLKPGEMIAVDIETGEFLRSEDIDRQLSSRHPYRAWLHEHTRRLEGVPDGAPTGIAPMSPADAARYQKMFHVTFEERDQVVRVLAEDGQEATGSMGDDTPMAVLSTQVRSPYDYFRQQFAQVTNPPIDPLREQIVMSLNTCFGPERNLFEETPEHARRLEVSSPVLSRCKFASLLALKDPEYRIHRIDLGYDSATGLEAAIAAVAEEAVRAVRAGAVIIHLSDRDLRQDRLPIHALFATGAVHHGLVEAGLRCRANILVETGTVRDPHHFACLLGYGATAVFPYLAYEVIRDMIRTGELGIDEARAVKHYRKGINKGLLKIISKMGISTIASYRGAQLFEAVGVHPEVIRRCFEGTPSRIGGARFEDFEDDQ
ncbi:MAG: glutamate synthase large subunit, partial [Acidiferrobacteraceae bacterium]